MILSFRTDPSGQTVLTQIRLLLEEQSDQGLQYLQFYLHLLDALLYGSSTLFQFEDKYSNFSGVWILRNYTVTFDFKQTRNESMIFRLVYFEPHHKKTCLQGLRPGYTQTCLLNYRDKLENWIFGLWYYFYLGSEQQRCWSDCLDAQADLRLCCSRMAQTGFLMIWLIWSFSDHS